MMIKFSLDDELPVNEMIEIPRMIIVVRADFFIKITNIIEIFPRLYQL